MTTLVRAGIWTSIATAVRILSGLIIVKLVSVAIGPSGLGKMGQFISLMTLMNVLAGGGISNGIIKYIAEYKNDNVKSTLAKQTAFTITMISAFVFAIIGIFFREQISTIIFGNNQYTTIIIILSICQLGIGLNNFFVALINGNKDYKRYTLTTLLGVVLGLFFMIILIKNYLLIGALIGLIALQTIPVVFSAPLVFLKKYIKGSDCRLIINKAMTSKFLRYSIMAGTTAIVTPIIQILIRNYLALSFSWEDVGYWQAVTKISDAYLLFITTALTAYYLPKLSEINEKKILFKEIISSTKIFVPLVSLLALAIYMLRHEIVLLLFSKDFMHMLPLFAYQLIGDVIKIISWMISFLMLAKAMTTAFIVTEVIFGISFYLLVMLCTSYFGLIGTTIAFGINSTLYLITMIFYLKFNSFININNIESKDKLIYEVQS